MAPEQSGRDDDTGRYVEQYPEASILGAIDENGGAAGTKAVADTLGCSYETAYRKLTGMDGERVTSERVGNARLWSRLDQ